MTRSNMKPKIKIAPSLLAADFTQLGEEIHRVEKAGCDMLHVDVMDGRFVPNLSVGPVVVQAIRRSTQLPLHVHLMIESPLAFIDKFATAGADQIIIHAEACGTQLAAALEKIREAGCDKGVSLKPATPITGIKPVLKDVESVLLMTVNPGFGGQRFMPEVLPKIQELRRIFDKDIAVDGGINAETCAQAIHAGANVIVSGTAIFSQQNAKHVIAGFRK